MWSRILNSCIKQSIWNAQETRCHIMIINFQKAQFLVKNLSNQTESKEFYIVKLVLQGHGGFIKLLLIVTLLRRVDFSKVWATLMSQSSNCEVPKNRDPHRGFTHGDCGWTKQPCLRHEQLPPSVAGCPTMTWQIVVGSLTVTMGFSRHGP